ASANQGERDLRRHVDRHGGPGGRGEGDHGRAGQYPAGRGRATGAGGLGPAPGPARGLPWRRAQMISRIFIDRPIFAWVIAIVIMMAGAFGIRTLSVEQYPDIAPPVVNINATYPGASAEVLENSVAQVIAQQLTGLDGMIYFQTTSNSAGQ